MSKKVKIVLVLLGIGVIYGLFNGPSVTDDFLEGKWSDGIGSVYVFDSEGDNGYNPVVFQHSSLVSRFGEYSISGYTVNIEWNEDYPDWELQKTGEKLILQLDGREGVTLTRVD